MEDASLGDTGYSEEEDSDSISEDTPSSLSESYSADTPGSFSESYSADTPSLSQHRVHVTVDHLVTSDEVIELIRAREEEKEKKHKKKKKRQRIDVGDLYKKH